MIKNLKLPIKVISGEICDANGKSIIKANRDSSTTPLQPTERDDLLKLIVKLVNANKTNESLNKFLNEDIAQLGDKVIFNKEKGFIVGQNLNGGYIVQVQGSTHWAKPSEVKVLNAKAKTMELPFKFDEVTQKVLFEQFVKCGIFLGNTPIKVSNCFVKYSQWKNAKLNEDVNVITDGELSIMPKENVRVFEDPNTFANPLDYVEGVIIDGVSEDAKESILINAMDYSTTIGDANGVRVIRGAKTENPKLETLPKAILRTLAV
jgi:hypothetical protein